MDELQKSGSLPTLRPFSLLDPSLSFNCYKHYCQQMKAFHRSQPVVAEMATPLQEDDAHNQNIEPEKILTTESVVPIFTQQPKQQDHAKGGVSKGAAFPDKMMKEHQPKKRQLEDRQTNKGLEGKFKKKGRFEKHAKIVEPIKRDIPTDQRHRLPNLRILDPRVSTLTVKQHEIYNATLLNFARTRRYMFNDGKEHEARKKAVAEENALYNEFVKQHAMSSNTFMKRFRINYRNYLIVKSQFFSKLDTVRTYPNKYKLAQVLDCAACLRPGEITPTFEYKKLLLESGKLPKMFLPNMEKKSVVDPIDVTGKDYDNKESITLSNDANIDQLVQKYAPNFVASFSALKTILLNCGSLHSKQWSIPILVDTRFVQGRKTRLVFLLKPLPPETLDVFQINHHRYKKALLVQLVDSHDKAVKGRRQQRALEPRIGQLFDDNPSLTDLDQTETFGSEWRPQSAVAADLAALDDGEITLAEIVAKLKPKKPANTTTNDSDVELANALKIQESDQDTQNIDKDHNCSKRGKSVSISEDSESNQLSMTTRRKLSSTLSDSGSTAVESPSQSRYSLRTHTADKNKVTSTPVNDERQAKELRTTKLANSLPAKSSFSPFDDVLGQILKDVHVEGQKQQSAAGDGISKRPGKKPRAAPYIVDPDETACENMHDFKMCLRPGSKLVQYALWQLNDLRVVVRSNLHGLVNVEYEEAKNFTKFEKPTKATVLPQLEYAWEYGVQQASPDQFLDHWWTAYLKRSFVHLMARINPCFNEMLSLDMLQSQNFHRIEQLESEYQLSIGQGIRRLGRVLTELQSLPENGWYLLRSGDDPNLPSVRLYKANEDAETTSQTDGDTFSISNVYNSKWLARFEVYDNKTNDFDKVWRPIDPNAMFQWHRILKRAPATFRPREDHEKPLLRVEQQPKDVQRPTHLTPSQKRHQRKQRIHNESSEGVDDDTNKLDTDISQVIATDVRSDETKRDEVGKNEEQKQQDDLTVQHSASVDNRASER